MSKRHAISAEMIADCYDDELMEKLLLQAPANRPVDKEKLVASLRVWAMVWWTEWRDHNEALQPADGGEMVRAPLPLATSLAAQLAEVAEHAEALSLGVAGLPSEATIALWKAAESVFPDPGAQASSGMTTPSLPLGVRALSLAIAQLDNLRIALKAAEAMITAQIVPGDTHRRRATKIRRQATAELLHIWENSTGRAPTRQNRLDRASGRESMPSGSFKDFLCAALAPIFGKLTADQIDNDLRAARRIRSSGFSAS